MNVHVVVPLVLLHALWQDGRLGELYVSMPEIRGTPFKQLRRRFFLRILLEQQGGALGAQRLWITSQPGRGAIRLLDGAASGPFLLLNLLVYRLQDYWLLHLLVMLYDRI